ncbi:MAG: PKD domain-containing protein [Saprospiraceae bacterium]|nr:PKD domain-containing protein [Saprospiraceae bacterium]
MARLRLLFILSSFVPILVQAQTASVTEGCVPLNVMFAPPAGQPSFFWAFKDGATSDLSNPSHVFITPGNYEVEFRLTSSSPVIGTIPITVYPKPDLTIAASPAANCPGKQIDFSDTTAYPVGVIPNSWSWTFGDGVGANETAPMHAYQTEGFYSITLAVITNFPSCNITKSFTDFIEVYTPPVASFETDPDPPSSCEPPLNLLFVNTSSGKDPLSYEWTLGNGTSNSGLTPDTVTYLQSGTFTIKLIVTDAYGCTGSATDIARVGTNALEVSLPDTICLETEFSPDNQTPAGVHSWNFGPAATPSTAVIRSPKVTFHEPGTYAVTYTWFNPAKTCQIDTTFTIKVEEIDLQIYSDIPEHCSAPVVTPYSSNYSGGTYDWTFGIFATSTEESPVFTYPVDPNIYSVYGERRVPVTLIMTSVGGCIDTLKIVDTFRLLTSVFEIDDYQKCVGDTFFFEDHSYSPTMITKWTWVFDDGQTLETTDPDPPIHIYDTCGLYYPYLIVDDAQGCQDSSYAIEVKVCGCEPDTLNGGGGICIPGDPGPPPPPGTPLCHGDSLIFSVIAGPLVEYFRLETDHDRLFHCPNSTPGFDSLLWVFNHETGWQDYKLSWESIYGDRDSLYLLDLFQVQGAWARPNYRMDCADPHTIQFIDSSMNATHLEWELPDGTLITDPSFTFTFPDTGDYTVYLSAWNEPSECKPHRDSVIVHIRDLKADFNMPPDACLGQPVSLDASASVHVNGTCHQGYTWFFSNGQRPRTWGVPIDSVAFNEPCEQDVILVVTDINGCTQSISKTINIQKIEVTGNVLEENICLPAQITGTASAVVTCGNLDKVVWSVENISTNGTDVTLDIPSGTLVKDKYSYINITAYTTLGCPATTIDSVFVYKPVSSIYLEPGSLICEGEDMTMTGNDFTTYGSYLTYHWTYGNGNGGNGKSVTTTYPDPGAYTIHLFFTEVATGCSDSLTRTIQVQGYPQAAFTSNVDTLDILCYPQNIFFQDASDSGYPLAYNWSFSNGQHSVVNDPATTFEKGTYTATLIVQTSAGCADTITKSYTLIGPEGDFEFDKDFVCLHESLTFTLKDTTDVGDWLWDFGDGTQQFGGNPAVHTYTYLPPDSATIATLVLTDNTGFCTYQLLYPVPIVVVNADFTIPPGFYCPGSLIPLENTSSNATLYQWAFSWGEASDETDPIPTSPGVGTYLIELVAINDTVGCVDTISKPLVIGEIELKQLLGDTICPGDTAVIAVLDSLPGFTFSWTPKSTLIHPDSAVTQATPTVTTTYTVTAADTTGCMATGQVTVVVLEPFSYPPWDTIVVKGVPVTLPGPAQTGYTYLWSPSTGLSCTTCAQPELISDLDQEYTLLIQDQIGCFETTVTYLVDVIPDMIDVPNLFTPNGDQTNSYFQIYVPGGTLDEISVLTMKVYSRWGTLVYDNDTPETGWDGTYKGEPCPMEVYAYVIEVEYLDGRREALRGDITLIR